MANEKAKHMGSGAWATIDSSGAIVTHLEGKGNEVHWTKEAFKNLVAYAKEKGFEVGDNDEGSGGEAEYLTMAAKKLAREIMADNSQRGVAIALELLRIKGWLFAPAAPNELRFIYKRSGDCDELQPEVPVDTEPKREEPDPWDRFG